MVKIRRVVSLSIIFLIVMTIVGCGAVEVKDGDTISVHYTGTLLDGTVFDSSLEREPLEFTLGDGKMIPGFEEAIIGMRVGQKKTVTIPADKAYGSRSEDKVFFVEREQLPEGLNPEVGQKLYWLVAEEGPRILVTVTEVLETGIVIDANHALAGKDLTFEIELIEIK